MAGSHERTQHSSDPRQILPPSPAEGRPSLLHPAPLDRPGTAVSLLSQLVFWHWWVLAGVLLILELWAPTYFFLWLGIAAAAVGFLVLVVPTVAFEVQLLTFALLSVLAVFGWRRLRDGGS